MEEALVNAITHGNRLDPDKHVRVGCRMSPELVRIEISRRGRRASIPRRVPNPTDPDRLECPCGRGVMLMKAFMSVEYDGAGNRVVLEKHRGKTP